MNRHFGDMERSKKQRPKCAKCRNHGREVLRLGHKGCCEFDSCNCEICKQTSARNMAMAKTMANERRRRKETNRDTDTKFSAAPTEGAHFGEHKAHRTVIALNYGDYNASNGGDICSSYGSGMSSHTTRNPFSSHNHTMESKVFHHSYGLQGSFTSQFRPQSVISSHFPSYKHEYKQETDRTTFGMSPALMNPFGGVMKS